jgi:alpha-ketoglutarate-dependent taurine dioxygenase
LVICPSHCSWARSISSERRAEYYRREGSRIASRQWHSDITFEPVPYDHAILKVHTNPPSGGDTLWASAYEPYSRLSREFSHFLEGREAYHEASFFNEAAKAYRVNLRTGQRGSPLNKGEHLSAVHPVIRVNRSLRTRRILGVSRDESDFILEYLNLSWA